MPLNPDAARRFERGEGLSRCPLAGATPETRKAADAHSLDFATTIQRPRVFERTEWPPLNTRFTFAFRLRDAPSPQAPSSITGVGPACRAGVSLRSQSVTLKAGRGRHRKYLPYAFTEQGVAMLSSVLRSTRAVQVNIEIMRAFVQLRQMLSSHADLARKLAALESRYDAQFKAVFNAIRELMAPQEPPKKRRIGFLPGD